LNQIIHNIQGCKTDPLKKELIKLGDRGGYSSWKNTHFPDTLLIEPAVAQNCEFHKFLTGTTSADAASKTPHDTDVK